MNNVKLQGYGVLPRIWCSSWLSSNSGSVTRDQNMDNIHANMFYEHLQTGKVEYGGCGLDDKHPFGSSNPEIDILTGIGIEPLNGIKG